jgi:hypothetical protein
MANMTTSESQIQPTTSSAVALVLRRSGILTGSRPLHEGVRVRSAAGSPNKRDKVYIHIQIDFDQDHADEIADFVTDVLTTNGLVFQHAQDEEGYHRFIVLGRAVQN